MKTTILPTNFIFTTFAFIFTTFAFAQPGSSDIKLTESQYKEAAEVLDNKIKEFDKELRGRKIDDYTIFNYIRFDKNRRAVTYSHQSTLDSNITQIFTEKHIESIDKLNKDRMCASWIKMFMKPMNLKVRYVYHDYNTNLPIKNLDFIYDASDCGDKTFFKGFECETDLCSSHVRGYNSANELKFSKINQCDVFKGVSKYHYEGCIAWVRGS